MESLPWSGRVSRFDEVESTNALALAAIDSGEGRHGDAFVAAAQTAGRGTRGRRWASATGGLYLSLILRSPGAPPAGLWTVAGALAVHDVCADLGVDATLDWPNDVVTARGGAKLAGVLAEGRGASGARPAAHALGVGVNVLASATPSAGDVGRPVASLEGEGATVRPDDVLPLLLDALQRRTAEGARDPKGLYGAFLRSCRHLAGAVVRLEHAGGTAYGRFVALDPRAGVGLEDPRGRVAWTPVGHVSGLRAAGADPPGGDAERPGGPPVESV